MTYRVMLAKGEWCGQALNVDEGNERIDTCIGWNMLRFGEGVQTNYDGGGSSKPVQFMQ